MSAPIIEMCVISLAEALAAERHGADQIELCINIDADGLTPPTSMIQDCLDQLNIHMKVLIRCREGAYVYTHEEESEMLASIATCRQLGVQEVVIGALSANGQLDLQFITEAVAIAQPMKVCIHKAIDASADILQSTTQLAATPGVTGILTSGGAATALQGATTIRQMIKIVGDDLQIVAAGKITYDNLDKVINLIGAPAYHGRRILDISSEK